MGKPTGKVTLSSIVGGTVSEVTPARHRGLGRGGPALLKQVPLFANLSARHLRKLASRCEVVRYPANRTVVGQGARGFFPFANRIDDFAAAIGAVAAGENVRQIRLAGGEVARDGAVAIQSQFWKNLLQPIVLLLLANRLQDHIEGLDKFRTFNELKRAAAVAPRLDKT